MSAMWYQPHVYIHTEKRPFFVVVSNFFAAIATVLRRNVFVNKYYVNIFEFLHRFYNLTYARATYMWLLMGELGAK